MNNEYENLREEIKNEIILGKVVQSHYVFSIVDGYDIQLL